MNYIISGLPSTGKTSICKKVSENSTLKYKNDYEILKENNISFSDNLAINKNDYSKYILNYIKNNDNLILDLQYTLSPIQVKTLNCVAYFLGFADCDYKVLAQLYSKKNNVDIKLSTAIAKQFILLSKNIENQCKETNIPYIEINKDRNKIIDDISKKILTNIEDN